MNEKALWFVQILPVVLVFIALLLTFFGYRFELHVRPPAERRLRELAESQAKWRTEARLWHALYRGVFREREDVMRAYERKDPVLLLMLDDLAAKIDEQTWELPPAEPEPN